MIKRIFCIILWSLLFYFIGTMAYGMIFSFLVLFKDLDIEANASLHATLTMFFAFLGLVLGAYLGYKESLPGTKKSNQSE